jgi:hypothetical protein
MARFSVTEAATAGFGIITRKPLAVLGWALALIVAVMLPGVLCFLAFGSAILDLMGPALVVHDSGLSPEALQSMATRMGALTSLNLLVWLWSVFVKAVFAGAAFRAVLAPEQSAWAYLRIGSRELWLTLLLLVEQVLAMIVVFVVVLLVVVLTAVVMVGAGENGHAAGLAVCSAVGLIAAGLLLWLALRLSMAAPMTFADNQFRLFESWALTKGQGWRLLGVALLIVLLLVCLEIVFGGVAVGALMAASGLLPAATDEASVRAFMARPPLELVRDLWPWLVGFGAAVALFAAVAQAVAFAPWAAVHRALTSGPEDGV